MGQAKQRGTFEQRQQAAYVAVDAADLTKDEAAQVELMEKRSEVVAAQIITARWKYSDIERRLSSFVGIDPAMLKVAKADDSVIVDIAKSSLERFTDVVA